MSDITIILVPCHSDGITLFHLIAICFPLVNTHLNGCYIASMCHFITVHFTSTILLAMFTAFQ